MRVSTSLSSDVLARLGSKTPALAWSRTALIFEILEPGRGPKPGQSRGLALPGDGFWKENKNKNILHIHHTKPMVLLVTEGLDTSAIPATSQTCHARQLTCVVHCEVIGLWAGWVTTTNQEVGTYRGDNIIVVVCKCAWHWHPTYCSTVRWLAAVVAMMTPLSPVHGASVLRGVGGYNTRRGRGLP